MSKQPPIVRATDSSSRWAVIVIDDNTSIVHDWHATEDEARSDANTLLLNAHHAGASISVYVCCELLAGATS